MPIRTYYPRKAPTRAPRKSPRSMRSRKSTAMRRTVVRRAPGFKLGVYHFKRWCQGNPNQFTITGNAAFAPYQGAMTFQLGDIANNSDFSSLFDHYRINKVVVRFWLRIDPSAQTAAGASYPKLYSVIDNDDSGLLSQLQMREHPNCKIQVMNPNRPIVRTFSPASLSLTYLSAVASTFSPQWKRWVDMANINVPHYGLKFNIDDLTNTNYRVDVETCVYFSVKGVR